mgnify:FL=1
MSFADDKIARAKILKLDGYEHLVKIAQGELPHGPFQELLDIRIEKVERGELTLKSRPTSHFYNPYGVAHGGYASSLLDTAMGCAVQTICPIGYGSTTLELKVNLVKAITEKAGELTIKGKVLHAGKTTATSEATIVDADGNLFAHSTCTCLKIKLQD